MSLTMPYVEIFHRRKDIFIQRDFILFLFELGNSGKKIVKSLILSIFSIPVIYKLFHLLLYYY